MCGVAGVHGAHDPRGVEMMAARLKHRGPDGGGILAGEGGVLGHTRLAIIDIAGGHQPMAHGGTVICFNGEIYNYHALRDRYLRHAALQTNSDTEVILHLYTLFGPSCVRLLEGMFALAILRGGELFLARDPLGIKPLYYGSRGGATYFASEIRALGPLVDEVCTLPPGSIFDSRHGVQRYYAVGDGWPLDLPPEREQIPQAIHAVLAQAVRKRLLADVPVGVSLSGGLDSSIVALLARREDPELETFAVGMEGSADLEAARVVAHHLGTRHHEYIYTPAEIEAALPEVVLRLESCDPALVRSAVPNYFLARLAAGRVKVILGGEGADELYAGYDYMRGCETPEALHAELLLTLRELHRTNLQRTDRMFMAVGVEGRVPFLDVEHVALALRVPAAWKAPVPHGLSKGLLRTAFADALPAAISARPKQKFSSGAGSADAIAALANEHVSDADFARERARLQSEWGYELRSKEGLYAYRMLREHLADAWFLPQMGVSRSL
jgi:asparagine synthase (glutamine-hydrolysing)